ncbi:MIOREX complex component 3 [Diutina catenulata]
MIKGIVRMAVPLTAFAAGVALFPNSWKKSAWDPRELEHTNTEVVEAIQNTALWKTLSEDSSYIHWSKNAHLPVQHRQNQVSSGLLFGRDGFEIDPVGFIDTTNGKLVSFFHLGKKLTSADGQIHNGVVATMLDEGLCMAGFPLLPSKRGVTAKLAIDFKNQAPPNSTVVLKAEVVESKGRKVVIDGGLSLIDSTGEHPEWEGRTIATAKCILVEPRWFKYFKYFQLI